MESLASQEVRQQLGGVVAERGCLIRCRDAPALQVVTHVGDAEIIRAIFAHADSESSHGNGGVLFARDRPEFQETIQQWLDPSVRKTIRVGTSATTTAQNDESEIDDDDDDEDD